MILGFKQQFPDKTPTNFKEKILSGEKIHSIRAGERWRPGMSIQMAYDVRTKNYKQFNKDHDDLGFCIEPQSIFMTVYHFLNISVDDRLLMPNEIEQLIKNGGLTRQQFISWFFPGNVFEFSGQIIHWTDFKY